MTPQEHKARHCELQEMLDELVADYLEQNPEARIGKNSIMDLMQWAAEQCHAPTESLSDIGLPWHNGRN